MSFKKNKYLVIKEAVPKEIAEFVYNYFLLKRKVARTLFDERYISNFTEEWGTWSDQQVPNTYSHYADLAMETLLMRTLPIMEEKTGLKLNPTYSYARIYKPGDVLHRHKDRFSCEISTTINLGGPQWPIYLEPDTSKGYFEKDDKGVQRKYTSEFTTGIEVNLEPGDIMIYRGNMVEHWREPLESDDAIQCFLHYNDSKTKDAALNAADTRQHLGLPGWFRGK